MAKGYGQTTYGASAGGATLSSNGSPEYATGGITIDWTTIFAAATDLTLVDGTVIKTGVKHIPFGTIMAQITQAEVQTFTITGTPTGGTTTYTFAGFGTTPAIAYNATSPAFQTAFESVFGVGKVTVSGTAPYTVTYDPSLLNVPTPSRVNGLTGGTSPDVTIATTTQGNASAGMFGPHQLTVTDGRQTLTKGKCFCLNQTIVESDAESQYGPGAMDGGAIYQSRLKKLNDAGTAYVAYPVDSNFNTAFPRMRLAEH